MKLVSVVLSAPLVLTAQGRAEAPAYPEPAKVRADLARLLERPKVPLDPSFTTIENGPLIVEKGTFASEAGKRVPALLARSARASGRLPVILVLHSTSGNKESMRDWVDPFAARGYLAVAIDARYHGEWVPGVRGSEAYNRAAVAAWRSKPGEKREYPFWYDSSWDVLRAIDYLLTRADVDPERVGVLGVSMGGIQTYFAAAVDSRIKVAVPLIATQSLKWSLDNGRWQGRARTIQAARCGREGPRRGRSQRARRA
jgi:dienelactone hydrolase